MPHSVGTVEALECVFGCCAVFSDRMPLPLSVCWAVLILLCIAGHTVGAVEMTACPLGLNVCAAEMTAYPLGLTVCAVEMTACPLGLTVCAVELTACPLGLGVHCALLTMCAAFGSLCSSHDVCCVSLTVLVSRCVLR